MFKNCKYCGLPFTPKHSNTMYCSKECKNKQRACPEPEPKECEYCGNTYIPNKYKKGVQRFCSKKCAGKWSYSNPKHDACVCRNCGKEYIPKASDRTSYCSRECAFEDYEAWRNIEDKKCIVCGKIYKAGYSKEYCSKDCKTKDYTKVCEICGKDFQALVKNSRLCSEECLREDKRRWDHEWARNKYEAPIYTCKECGREFSPGYGEKKRTYCSAECSRKYLRRVGKAIRKARIRGCKEWESVDPIYILNRDKWKCQKCGIKTPKRLRGSIEDNAPEVDHIIPLASGGEHKAGNLQGLCRKCNQEKGATAWGQLRLC